MICSLLITGITIASTPWTTNVIALCAVLFVNGTFLGVVEATGTVWTIVTWNEMSSPFIQILYFMFGVGAIIGPLVTKPFLISETIQTISFNKSSISTIVEQELQVQWPYTITAIVTVLATAAFIVVYNLTPLTKSESLNSDDNTVDMHIQPTSRLVMIGLGTLFCHFYFATTIVSGTFYFLYATECDLQILKDTATLMVSVFWISQTVFRIPSIYIGGMIGLFNSIVVQLIVVMLANGILLPYGNINIYALCIGMALLGTGLSSIFGLFIGYVNNLFKVTGTITSMFILAGCLGEFLWPLAVSQYIDIYPQAFLISLTITSTGMCIVFAVMRIVSVYFLVKRSVDTTFIVE